MTDEKYIEQFLKEDSLFIVIKMDGRPLVRKVLQNYIEGDEFIYTRAFLKGANSETYNSNVRYEALLNSYDHPKVFIVKEEY